MDKLIDYYNNYHDRIMAWYDALTYLEQIGVLFVLFVGFMGLAAYIKLRK